jgi:hypothetical protein
MYRKLFVIIKKIISPFYSNIASQVPQKNITNNPVSDANLPDIATLEQTMFMLERIRLVFDFAPPIPLISEMRIINRGLSFAYQTPSTHHSSEEKAVITSEITQTVHKFAHILPEIDFLLTKIENLSTTQASNKEAEEIKKEIIFSLEKVSYDKDALRLADYPHDVNNEKKYYITFDSDK